MTRLTNKRIAIAAGVMLFALLASGMLIIPRLLENQEPDANADAVCTIDSKLVNSCRPWFGATAGGYPQATGNTGSLAQFEYFNKRLNNPDVLVDPAAAANVSRKMDITHTYHTPGKALFSQDTKNVLASNILNNPNNPILVGYKPAGADGIGNWAATARGDHDANIRQSAQAVKALGQRKIFIHVWGEPEAKVNAQGVAITGTCKMPTGTIGSAEDYRAMWRRVRQIFNEEGATNVVWTVLYMGWVKESQAWDCIIDDLWPGNDLVDWVMWDPYSSGYGSFYGSVNRMYSYLTENSNAEHDYLSKVWGVAEHGSNSTPEIASKYWLEGKSVIGSSWAENKLPRIKLWSVFDTSVNGGTNGGLRVGYDDIGNVSTVEQSAFNQFATNILDFGSKDVPAPTDAPPSGAITAPLANSTVAGIVDITADAADDAGVVKVNYLIDNVFQKSDTAAPYLWSWDTSKVANGSHSVRIRIFDALNQVTEHQITVTVNNAVVDTQPPMAPSELSAILSGSSKADLAWKPSTDNTAVAGYYIRRGSTTIADVKSNTYSDSGLQPSTSYSYSIVAYDAAGNISSASNVATITTPAPPDTTPPSVPAGLTATAISTSQINLKWLPSTDNVSIARYDIYRNGSKIGSSTTTSFGDSGLSSDNTYSYYINAVDGAGNQSSQSSTVSASTLPPPVDTAAPTAPANLKANGRGKTISLSWSPSSDNVGIKGYFVYREGVRILETSTTTSEDRSTRPRSSSRYYTRAFDEAGNIGPASNTATAAK